MFTIIPGISAQATVTELRSSTSELIDHAVNGPVLISKNSAPVAVLVAYDEYVEMSGNVNPDEASNDVPDADTDNGDGDGDLAETEAKAHKASKGK